MQFTRKIKMSLWALLVVVSVHASEIPQMKMSTPIPQGIVTPDTLETKLGTLNNFNPFYTILNSQRLKWFFYEKLFENEY